MEEIYRDWQRRPDDEATLATGGEGAVELEATAPVDSDEAETAVEGVKHVVYPPMSEEDRDKLRAKMSKHYPSTRGLEYGPNGQMVSTGHKTGRRHYDN